MVLPTHTCAGEGTVTVEQTRTLSDALLDEGFFVPASEYPGGPSGVYLRISVTARHRGEDLDRFAAALAHHAPRCRARSA